MQTIRTPQSRFKRTIKNASRLKNILKVLVRNGFQNLVRKSHLADYLPGPWVKDQTTSFSTPQRLRMCLEELGPTFIKLGQILSTRTDLLPREYLAELQKLQDEVPAVPYDEIQELLTEQYPQGIQKVFDWIEPKPVGSASMAQVHRGKLLSGQSIVLKIQKPGIQETVSEDIEVLRFIVEAMHAYIPEFKKFNLPSFVEEFAQTIQEETDFLLEAHNTRRFYEVFQSRESIIVPRPYIEISGSKVFVMEYIQGTPLKEFSLRASQEQKAELVRRGLNAYFAMILKDGYFHADLHLGNMLVVDGKHLAIVDYGTVGRLTKKLQQSIVTICIAISQDDFEKIANEYIDIAATYQAVDRDGLAKDLRKTLSPHLSGGTSGVHLAQLMVEAATVVSKHDLILPSELFLFSKSLVVVEGAARSLGVNFDWFSFVSEKATETRLPQDPMKVIAELALVARDISALTKTLPMELRTYWRKKNHPSYAEPIEIKNLDLLVKAQIKSAKLICFALILSSFIIALTLIFINQST